MGLKILIDTNAAKTSDPFHLYPGDKIVSSGLGAAESVDVEQEIKPDVWAVILENGSDVTLTETDPDVVINAYGRYRVVSTGTTATITVTAYSPNV